MTHYRSGLKIYDHALDLVEQGTAVSIIPICSEDDEGLYALTLDLNVRKTFKPLFTSGGMAERAGSALGLTLVAIEMCEDTGLQHRFL